MRRIVGLDVGARRVGVALSDPLRIFARPLVTLPFTTPRRLVRDLEEIIRREDVELVVIGCPAEGGGRESEPARLARAVCALLEERSVACRLVDESYTSREAEEVIHEHGKRRKAYRSKIDQIAAALILKKYLDTLK
jgi:putative Holliday junction resolvase